MHLPARRLLMLAALLPLLPLVAACTGDERARTTDDIAPLYVAIGASDSVGTGARDPATQGWVPVLHGRMPAGTRLANLGISGLKLRQALDQVLPVALDLQPSVVTIWLAANDFAAGVMLDEYQSDLDTLLGALAQGTPARVYVLNLPDLTLLPAFRDRPQEQLRMEVALWNLAIAESAARHGAVVVDLYTGWTELAGRPEYISRDGFHPSSRGHGRLADYVWRMMQINAAERGAEQAVR